MKIDYFINSDYILTDLKGVSVSGCLYEMLIHLESAGVLVDKQKMLVELIDREEQSSTVLFPKIAFPHIYSNDAITPVISIGKSVTGVNFKSVTGEKIHFIFLIVLPTEGEWLWIFSDLLERLSEESIYDKIKNSSQAVEIAMHIKKLTPFKTNVSFYKGKEIYNERAD